MMPLLVFVVGARPNFMKVAPVLRAIRAKQAPFCVRLVHTGQHYSEQMSEVFFQQLGLPTPDVYLGVGSGTHGSQTARVLEAFEKNLSESNPRPCGVVVAGDVNSTMACALAAVKLGIPVAHIEAGLRSFDRSMPEEINRVVTDAISDLLLVSEPHGEENLRREGMPANRVRYVGNVMIDTLVHELPASKGLDMPGLLGLIPGRYALVTLHRPANVDDEHKLARIVSFLNEVSSYLPVVFPVHPRCSARLNEYGLTTRLDNNGALRLLEPLAYRENLSLLSAARVVITDSGGLQEEATFLGVPCLTLRNNTERPITVTAGTNTIVGDDFALAGDLIKSITAGHAKRGTAIRGWDGRASDRVVDALVESWGAG